MAVHPAIALAWVAWILTWSMAVFVYAAAPSRPGNRRLAVIFFLHGVAIGEWVLIGLFPTRRAGASFAMMNYVALLAIPFLYIWLLATLDTPLARLLRTRIMQLALFVGMAAMIVPLYVRRPVFFGPLEPWFGGGWGPSITPATIVLFEISLLLVILALALTIQAYRRAPKGTPARDRAFWFMLAFGLHDLYYLYRTGILMLFVQAHTAIPGGWVGPTIQYGRPLSLIVWVLLLAYGMLRHQVLGLDLKVKANLRRAFVLAPIAIAFFVASEALEGILPVQDFWLGLAAAGLITLGIVPLQRGAQRLVDRLMPDTQDTPEYKQRRREEIYALAVHEVRQDGVVDAADQAMLDRLALRLGMRPDETRHPA